MQEALKEFLFFGPVLLGIAAYFWISLLLMTIFETMKMTRLETRKFISWVTTIMVSPF